jgi:hypothetical protein
VIPFPRRLPALAALAAAAAASTLATAAPLALKPGDPAVIRLPEAPSETERFAASELQRYARQLCGLELAIAQEAEPPQGAAVFWIQRARAPEDLARFDPSVAGPGKDSFHLKVEGRSVRLTGGGDRGVLYGVYELLERQGCRWFMPGPLGEVVPRRADFVLAETDRLFVPRFLQRELAPNGGEGMTPAQVVDWEVKNRLNRDFNRRVEAAEWTKRGGFLQWQWIAHNYKWILPPEKYFKEHPEYYALYKGQRVELGNEKGNVCTTHPDVLRLFAEFVSEWFDKNPEGSVFPLSPPDGAIRWCECPSCQALGGINFMPGTKGSMSRRQVAFVNEVARRVRAKHPDRFLLLLAYQNTADPVPDLRLEPNVLAQVAHHGCFAHGYGQCPENKAAAERLRGWAAMADRASGSPGVWDYFLLQIDGQSGSKLAPVPFARTARDSVRFLDSLGGRWFFTQTGPLQHSNPFVFYALARLLWDPALDFDALEKDFHSAFYGPAAAPMLRLNRLLEERVQAAAWHPTAWPNITAPSPLVFTPAALAEAEKLLAEAERLAAAPPAKARVALARASLDFAKSATAQSTPWVLKRGETSYVVNADAGPDNAEEVAKLAREKQRSSDPEGVLTRLIFRLQKRELPILAAENARLRVSVLPGVGGRILRLVDQATGVSFLREPRDVTTLANPGAGYFSWGGYEEYVGTPFASPGWEQAYEVLHVSDGPCAGWVMRTSLGDLKLERKVLVPNGDAPELQVESTLTNGGAVPVKTRLRVHPEMRMAENHEGFSLVTLDTQGKLARAPIGAGLRAQPAGLWAVVDAADRNGIAHLFDPAEAEALFVFVPQEQFFNMELMGRERTLAPGESLKITHRYHLLKGGTQELEKLVPTRKPM